jgi:hypothetical protein
MKDAEPTKPQPAESRDRWQESKKWLTEFINEFLKESDRACVVLCAAKMDSLLGQILAKFLVPNAGSQDELLGAERALGTFSSRIHAAYRLGLIEADLARALHLIRKIRNDFAHDVAGTSFDHGTHKDRIRELVAPLTQFTEFHDMKKQNFGSKPDTAGCFYVAASTVLARLEVVFHELTPLTSGQARSLIVEGWSKND